MKAIILAAGVGKRLWPVTQHKPKCLIEIGGQTLLSRYLESLASVKIRQATVVVGYKQEMIRAAVGTQCHGIDISYLVNEEFHRGSISSLWIARQALTDDVVIMDADVLFHREILRRLVASPYENCLLMDDTVKQTGEECMVVVQGDRVIALSKKVPDRYDLAGEGVGFLRVRRADAPHVIGSLKGYIDQDRWDMEYEDGLLQYFRDVKVGHEKIGGLPWTEIDFPEDVTKAEREVLPRL
ncbi:MAG TPA: phosphocholine cytidylyltransferase family protein [Nitrospira sp.]|nr:phosphocholine cytidylyltransferase family protein [Nitrospira sp.]